MVNDQIMKRNIKLLLIFSFVLLVALYGLALSNLVVQHVCIDMD